MDRTCAYCTKAVPDGEEWHWVRFPGSPENISRSCEACAVGLALAQGPDDEPMHIDGTDACRWLAEWSAAG
jgi:hypothetical protein